MCECAAVLFSRVVALTSLMGTEVAMMGYSGSMRWNDGSCNRGLGPGDMVVVNRTLVRKKAAARCVGVLGCDRNV